MWSQEYDLIGPDKSTSCRFSREKRDKIDFDVGCAPMLLLRFIPRRFRSHQLVDASKMATVKGLDRVEKILRSAGTCTINNVISAAEADADRLAVQKFAEANRFCGHHHLMAMGRSGELGF